MSDLHVEGVGHLVETVSQAVGSGDVAQIVDALKHRLKDACTCRSFQLPPGFRSSDGDHYARRLIHRDEDLGYTVVAMTWGPGQSTDLHDHAGIWCVECVVEGALNVTQYDLVEARGDRYRFESQQTVRAGVGDAGCLIPPYEYHVLANALPDRPSITLHVYGGEMDHCNSYIQDAGGWWTRHSRELAYTAEA